MGCFRISEKASKLRQKYKEIYGELPRGWYFENNETMQEYEEYLEKELNKKDQTI